MLCVTRSHPCSIAHLVRAGSLRSGTPGPTLAELLPSAVLPTIVQLLAAAASARAELDAAPLVLGMSFWCTALCWMHCELFDVCISFSAVESWLLPVSRCFDEKFVQPSLSTVTDVSSRQPRVLTLYRHLFACYKTCRAPIDCNRTCSRLLQHSVRCQTKLAKQRSMPVHCLAWSRVCVTNGRQSERRRACVPVRCRVWRRRIACLLLMRACQALWSRFVPLLSRFGVDISGCCGHSVVVSRSPRCVHAFRCVLHVVALGQPG